MYKNIGYHTTVKDLLSKEDSFFDEHKTFQVFIGSPRVYEPGSVTDLCLFRTRHPDVEIVVHCSFVCNLCKSSAERVTQSTLAYLIKFAKLLDSCGIQKMVLHPGARSKTDSIKQSMVYLWDNCQRFLLATQDCSIHLLLESDSGSKENTKMGDMRVLKAVVDKIDNPRLRICFDTEHSYAAGFDFKSDFLKYYNLIECIHLNSVPHSVEFGKHLDRHTETTFYESKVSVSEYLDILFDTYGDKIPMIMEIDVDLAPRNYQWLEEVYNGKVCDLNE